MKRRRTKRSPFLWMKILGITIAVVLMMFAGSAALHAVYIAVILKADICQEPALFLGTAHLLAFIAISLAHSSKRIP